MLFFKSLELFCSVFLTHKMNAFHPMMGHGVVAWHSGVDRLKALSAFLWLQPSVVSQNTHTHNSTIIIITTITTEDP